MHINMPSFKYRHGESFLLSFIMLKFSYVCQFAYITLIIGAIEIIRRIDEKTDELRVHQISRLLLLWLH